MIPITHATYADVLLSRLGLLENCTCSLCEKPCRARNTATLVVHEYSTKHVEWPEAPWMYLWFCDNVRSGIALARYVDPQADEFFFWNESKKPVCLQCMLAYITEIEDSCKGTSYEQLVDRIRAKHDTGTSNEDVQRLVQPDEVHYPSILGSLTGWPDSNSPEPGDEDRRCPDQPPPGEAGQC